MQAATVHRPLVVEMINRHQQTAPVDLEAIARDLGIAVRMDPTLPSTVSGKITRVPRTRAPAGFAITVNANHHPNRRRFTLAHEIAHYMLHRSEIGDEIVDDGMYRSTALRDHDERMADRQAAEIILPAPLVRAEHARDPAPETLALRFEVSERAIRIRLRELGLAG